jgi:hypothetical protein
MSNLTVLQTSLVVMSSLIAMSTLPTQDQNTQPKDAAAAKELMGEEQEEERLDDREKGLTVPEGFPRPALIIVMVSS